ncbi:MAG: hypothetical protein ACREQ5_18890 [Candidatus Dormibacteria bacterium]
MDTFATAARKQPPDGTFGGRTSKRRPVEPLGQLLVLSQKASDFVAVYKWISPWKEPGGFAGIASNRTFLPTAFGSLRPLQI